MISGRLVAQIFNQTQILIKMNAKDYYEEMRKAGLTNDITSNDEPDYKQPFYQNIFRLMEGFAQQRKITSVTQFDDATNPASSQTAVMGSVVKALNWIDNPEKRHGDIYKVMSRADVPMPHTVGNARIEITEHTYPYNCYEATLWCFNGGTYIGEGKSVDEAKHNAFKWWVNFVSGFLNCP